MTCKNHPVMTKALCRATVADNLSISENFYRLKLLLKGNCAKSFSSTLPGQFAEFELSGLSVPDKAQISENLSDASQRTLMLRRPFSFADVTIVDRQNVTLDVLYCVLGPGTLRMKNLKPGDEINLIGPLGNGFSIPKNKKHALLVAGGMGAPPIQHLAEIHSEKLPQHRKNRFCRGKIGIRTAVFQYRPQSDYCPSR